MYGRTALGPWSVPVLMEREQPAPAPEPKLDVRHYAVIDVSVCAKNRAFFFS
jgi:hypothetical protein